MEGNFNDKISKPSLKPASPMGKKIDTQFKNKMQSAGVNFNMIKESKTMINEKEESLKKKIFSLPKMETLVMTDEYLSNIYNKLKEDAQETYGYHWNETIMNIMFNEYILNDNAYLQKYKNTKTYNKKRRGQEGVEELEKNLQDKIDSKDGEDKPEFNREKKMADIDTNKDELEKFKQSADKEEEPVDEMFGFGKPTVPLITHKPSKNDTYFVKKGGNSAVGVISSNLDQEANQATAAKFADSTQYERMPWYVAVTKKIKGVPTEVADGSLADFQADNERFAGIPSLAEQKNMDKDKKITDGSGFELQFNTSTEAEAKKAAEKDSTYHNELIYQNETTTSASSGAFSGPFPAKRKPVLDKPLWVGGTIIKESVDYLSNPNPFKSYVTLVESVDTLQSLINECEDVAEGVSIKDNALHILAQLKRMETETPELKELPEFNYIRDLYTKRSQTGKVDDQPVEVGVETETPVAENHLQSKQDKINFIISKNGPNQKLGHNELAVMDDAQIDQLYQSAEGGISEEPNHNAALKQDIKNTGRPVPSSDSTSSLQQADGLFKDRIKEAEEAIQAADGDTGGDIFSKIAQLVFPDARKSPQDLANLGKNFHRDFFSKVAPEQAYKLLYDKFKSMNLAETMVDDQQDSMARTMDSPELNTAGAPAGGGSSSSAAAPVSENNPEGDVVDTAAQGDRQDKEAIADASKFREYLKSKYGVESVSDMSPEQKRQVMKDIAAGKAGHTPAPEPEVKSKPELDLKNFAATDAQRAEYQARDNKQLSFVAQHDAEVSSIQDYLKLEKLYAQENGEKMFHPMAILASIKAMPEEEKAKYANTASVLMAQVKGNVQESTQTTKKMNEERLTPSQLNLQKVQKETEALTKKDMANADALKQARVYPNPDEFYIEQDDAKVQDFKSAADLEAEALKTMEEKKALANAGNSTNDNGKEIVKRNLTKDEMLRLAMDRGDGMHNIVYDTKPSEKFEKRLEKDMGEDQYKLRKEKMEYREDAPMYNKDTQPTEKGENKLQDNKYKDGFNEAFTGKYTDDFGKTRLVEFIYSTVEELETITEGFKLTLDGLGNKFTVKINENELFADVMTKYDFYLVENKVMKTKIGSEVASTLNENAMNKMMHLMGYNTRDFVNTKKSTRF